MTEAAAKYPTTPMCDGTLLEQFEPTTRDTDVFIATAAKCGQTWLQALLFHMRTGGREPDFRGLGLHGVSPWLEWPPGFNSDSYDRDARLAELEALDDPRLFKMHVVWEEIPRPKHSAAKIVTITRDPRDLPYSMFCHLQAMKKGPTNEAVSDDFDAYFEKWMEFGFFFKFVRSFWPHHDDEDVLWLRYEDMQADLESQAHKIVTFLGWQVDHATVKRVLPMVAFSNMQRTEKTTIFKSAKKTWKSDRKFFREGGVGKNRAHLSEEQSSRIVERARQEFSPECFELVMCQGGA